MNLIRLLLSLLFALPAAAEMHREPEHFLGYAYDLESGAPLYAEQHRFRYAGDRLVADHVTYLRPDGRVFGDKRIDFRPSLFVPDFHTRLQTPDYEEGLRRNGEAVELFRRKKAGGKLQLKRVEVTKNSAADAGFHPYVQAHFEKLMAGDTVRFHFLSADFLMRVKFKAWRIADGRFEGRSVARFKVKVASLLGAFVDPLIISYDPETRFLHEFRGISNVKGPDGDAYDVRIIYPSRTPPEFSAAAAAAEKLRISPPSEPY